MFLGNLFDDTSALEWIFSQSDDDSIEELTSPMIEKLIRESKNVVVLFCKYAGYMLIAITHTCYMLRYYSGSGSATPKIALNSKTAEDIQNQNQTTDLHLNNGDIFLNNGSIEQRPSSHTPIDRIKGLPMEA